jgi:hypothetical protein
VTIAVPPTTGDARPVVDLPGGRVTLERVEQLTARRDQLASQAADFEARATHMTQDAALKARQAGAILVVQRGAWATSELSQDFAKFDQRTGQIDQVDAQLAEISSHARQGLSGFFKRFGDRHRRAALIKQRDQLAAEVAAALQELGERAPQTTLPEADALLGAAQGERAQAAQLRDQRQAQQTEVEAMSDEIRRRGEAIKKLGFDALWTAAWLQNHEPPAIESPLAMKRGEVAWLSVDAVLSRQATRTQWTGRSQGISIPIGHTGIRYRVGSFRGHPIETTAIKNLDSGSLVLTNQRLAFIGRLKSVTIGLSHIVHVEAYTDALGVFQDRRETPDFFKLQAPQYVLFYINHALERQK